MADLNTGHDLSVSVKKLDELVAVRERSEIVMYVAGLAAHVGMERKVPLGALDEMTNRLERQLQAATLIPAGQAARMVPVQMCRDHRIDLFGADAQALQRLKQRFRLAERYLLRSLLTELCPDPRLADDDASVHARD